MNNTQRFVVSVCSLLFIACGSTPFGFAPGPDGGPARSRADGGNSPTDAADGGTTPCAGGGCYVRSLDVARVCRVPRLAAQRAGQFLAVLTSREFDCRERALQCVVRLEGGTLFLDPFVTLADPHAACTEPPPSELTVLCVAPALPAGRYPVVAGGLEALFVTVGDTISTNHSTNPAECFDATGWPLGDLCERVDSTTAEAACSPTRLPTQTYTTVPFSIPTTSCHTQPGTCATRVEGSTITLVPRHRECGREADCSRLLQNSPLRCVLPPLAPGRYEVWRNGQPAPALEVEPGASVQRTCDG